MKTDSSVIFRGSKKKRVNAIFWGIILILAAAGLLLLAVEPDVAVLEIPLWKILIAVFLLWWLVRALARLSVSALYPFALLFLLFEKEIARVAGLKENFVNNWLVAAAAVLLSVGLTFLLKKHRAQNGKTSLHKGIGDTVLYLDADECMHTVEKTVGDVTVFFRNVENGKTDPIRLNVRFCVGDLMIHVPASWHVECLSSAKIGDNAVRDNPASPERSLLVEVTKSVGDVTVVS